MRSLCQPRGTAGVGGAAAEKVPPPTEPTSPPHGDAVPAALVVRGSRFLINTLIIPV